MQNSISHQYISFSPYFSSNEYRILLVNEYHHLLAGLCHITVTSDPSHTTYTTNRHPIPPDCHIQGGTKRTSIAEKMHKKILKKTFYRTM